MKGVIEIVAAISPGGASDEDVSCRSAKPDRGHNHPVRTQGVIRLNSNGSAVRDGRGAAGTGGETRDRFVHQADLQGNRSDADRGGARLIRERSARAVHFTSARIFHRG
jgi:hypothetical protein